MLNNSLLVKGNIKLVRKLILLARISLNLIPFSNIFFKKKHD